MLGMTAWRASLPLHHPSTSSTTPSNDSETHQHKGHGSPVWHAALLKCFRGSVVREKEWGCLEFKVNKRQRLVKLGNENLLTGVSLIKLPFLAYNWFGFATTGRTKKDILCVVHVCVCMRVSFSSYYSSDLITLQQPHPLIITDFYRFGDSVSSFFSWTNWKYRLLCGFGESRVRWGGYLTGMGS